MRPPLALVYQWFASSCIRALDAYGRADVNWRIASRAEEDAWNKYNGAYLWGNPRSEAYREHAEVASWVEAIERDCRNEAYEAYRESVRMRASLSGACLGLCAGP